MDNGLMVSTRSIMDKEAAKSRPATSRTIQSSIYIYIYIEREGETGMAAFSSLSRKWRGVALLINRIDSLRESWMIRVLSTHLDTLLFIGE